MKERFGSIAVMVKRCSGCVSCMKACPTKAIRTRTGVAVINYERCIDCGECISACPNGAIVPLTSQLADFRKMEVAIALPSPAIYSQFDGKASPNDILVALKKCGFQYVFDEAWTCERVNVAIEEHLKRHRGPRPLISSFCPAVVRLIQKRFPTLTEYISPLQAPREVAARERREKVSRETGIDSEKIGVFYITPCPAKLVAINNPPTKERSHLNGAISIAEVYGKVKNNLKIGTDEEQIQKSSGLGLSWAMQGGEIRGLEAIENSLSVSGIRHVIEVLEAVENGHLQDIDYMECRACLGGCIGGQLTVENPYIARSRIERLIKAYPGKSNVNKERVLRQYCEGYFSSEKPPSPVPMPPLDKDKTKAIEMIAEREKLVKKLRGINCGACGAPDCVTFAEDVVKGEARLEDCVFVNR